MRTIALGQSLARRMIDHLDKLLRERGHGSIRALERTFGVASGWWGTHRRSGDIRLSAYSATAEHLGRHPGRLFDEVLGKSGLRRHRPHGNPPPIVAVLEERLARGSVDAPAGAGEPAPSHSLLQVLDRQSFQDPQLAIATGLTAVPVAEDRLLPRILGIVGSSYRRWNSQLDAAEHCLQAGLDIAEDPLTVGDLLQRLAYVVADRGDHAEALALAEKATVIYVDCGDDARLGQTCVDRGMLLNYLNRLPEAIRAQTRALELLPNHETLHRFAALQNLGRNYQDLGDLTAAQDFALRAMDLLPALNLGVDPKGKLLWLLAKIAFEINDLEQSEEYLRQVVELYSTIHQGEAVLASTDLVRVLLLLNRPGEAWEVAKTMRAFVWRTNNRIITAALSDLLHVQQSALTLALVEQAKTRLSELRERPEWRSLGV